MTTNKDLQNLYDLRFSIKDLKAEFERNPLTKSRFGSLILTKLDEAYHWAGDLTDEIETRDLRNAKAGAKTLQVKINELAEQCKNVVIDREAIKASAMSKEEFENIATQVLGKANAPKTGE